jgi:hypothetical protein
VGVPAARTRLRQWHDMLAPSSRMDASRRLAACPRGDSATTPRARPDRVESSLRRCCKRTGTCRGEHTGRNPTDRGKLGSKHHSLVDERGLPLVAQLSGAQVHDSRFLIPLVESIPAVKELAGRARKRPGKLHADRAYASRTHRTWLRSRASQLVSRATAWSHANGLAGGVGSSREPWVGYTASADCAFDMSDEQTCTRRSCRFAARSSVGGTSRGFVRRSKLRDGGAGPPGVPPARPWQPRRRRGHAPPAPGPDRPSGGAGPARRRARPAPRVRAPHCRLRLRG